MGIIQNQIRKIANRQDKERNPYVVNVRDDLGFTGTDPKSGRVTSRDVAAAINDDLDKDDNDHIRYVFPSGTYKWNTRLQLPKYDRVEFVGEPHAYVKPTDDTLTGMVEMSGGPGGSQAGYAGAFVWDNLSFDLTTDGVGPTLLYVSADDLVQLTNFRVDGQVDDVEGVGAYNIHPTVPTKSGNLIVKNVDMPDGSYYDPTVGQVGQCIGLSLEKDHRGKTVIENVLVEGFTDNGIYSGVGRGYIGQVTIRNCLARNNGNANIRVGSGHRVEHCRIELNDERKDGLKSTGLYVDGANGTVVDGVRVVAFTGVNDAVRVSGSSGGAVTDDVTLNDITIFSNQGGPVTGNYKLLDIQGDGAHNQRIIVNGLRLLDTGGGDENHGHPYVIYCNRDNVTFNDADIHTAGDYRHAFHFAESEGIRLNNCDVSFEGENARAVEVFDDCSDLAIHGGSYDNDVYVDGSVNVHESGYIDGCTYDTEHAASFRRTVGQ